MDFLAGAADLHVHSAPDVDPRRFNDIELAREAARAGMGALLIKSHQNSTVERAALVSYVVPEIRTFGGLVLNETVGGFNLAAVRLALRMGAKEIWMPTRDARNHRRFHGHPGGLASCGEDGALLPVLVDILRAIAEADAILGTGHLSPQEALCLIRRARQLGVRKILVTHPEWAVTFYAIALQQSLAAEGVCFERCFVSTTHHCGFTPFATIADAIAAVGPASTVLATDLGQVDTPAPAVGLRLYAERLLAEGFSPDQLHAMLAVNPLRLLGLDSKKGDAGCCERSGVVDQVRPR